MTTKELYKDTNDISENLNIMIYDSETKRDIAARKILYNRSTNSILLCGESTSNFTIDILDRYNLSLINSKQSNEKAVARKHKFMTPINIHLLVVILILLLFVALAIFADKISRVEYPFSNEDIISYINSNTDGRLMSVFIVTDDLQYSVNADDIQIGDKNIIKHNRANNRYDVYMTKELFVDLYNTSLESFRKGKAAGE
jgi:hypothetical protein